MIICCTYTTRILPGGRGSHLGGEKLDWDEQQNQPKFRFADQKWSKLLYNSLEAKNYIKSKKKQPQWCTRDEANWYRTIQMVTLDISNTSLDDPSTLKPSMEKSLNNIKL